MLYTCLGRSTQKLLAVAIIVAASSVNSTIAAEHSVEWEFVQRTDRPFKIPNVVGYQNNIGTQVNQSIDQATEDLRCDVSASSEAERVDFDVKLHVDFAQHDVFSVYATKSYFCGTAYPTNDATFSMTFDLVTGKKIEFQDLFVDFAENKEKILRIIFTTQIERAERADRTKDDGSCENADFFRVSHLLDTSEFDFSVSNRGLRVQPRWPHAIEACAERVEVPFEKLEPYADSKSILARLIQRAKVIASD